MGGAGTLRYLAVHDSEYPEFEYSSLLVDPKQPATSEWKTRSNVKLWWRNGANAQYGGPIFKGDLGPLTSNGRWFGPEFGFGQIIGDYYKNDDVLLIKPSWGGHNLVSQFRSPNAVAKRGGAIGPSYIEMFENAREVLFQPWQRVSRMEGPGLSDRWLCLASGHQRQELRTRSPRNTNTTCPTSSAPSARNSANPSLPFVIATTGMGYDTGTSPPPYENYHAVEKAQLWVAGVEKPANVLTDDTRGYFEPH